MSANDQRGNDAAPERNVDQEEAQVNEAEMSGSKSSEEDPEAEPWTREQYNNWAISRYMPIILEVEQVQKLHMTTVSAQRKVTKGPESDIRGPFVTLMSRKDFHFLFSGNFKR